MLSLSFFFSATSSSSSSSSSPSPPLSMLCFRQSLIHLPVFVFSRALHNERLDSLVLLRIKRVETICVSYFRSPVIPLSLPSVLLSVFCRSSPPFLYCVPLLSILTQSPKNLSSVFLYPTASLFPHLLFSSLVPPYFFLSFSPPPTLMLLSYSLILFLSVLYSLNTFQFSAKLWNAMEPCAIQYKNKQSYFSSHSLTVQFQLIKSRLQKLFIYFMIYLIGMDTMHSMLQYFICSICILS